VEGDVAYLDLNLSLTELDLVGISPLKEVELGRVVLVNLWPILNPLLLPFFVVAVDPVPNSDENASS
jgi:hypothetical protein